MGPIDLESSLTDLAAFEKGQVKVLSEHFSIDFERSLRLEERPVGEWAREILPLIASTEPGLAIAAAWELHRLVKDRETVREMARDLRRYLEDQSPSVRWHAVVGLGQLGKLGAHEGAIDTLIACLRDPSFHVREAAAGALGRMGDQAVNSVVFEALANSAELDPQTPVRRAAERTISVLSDLLEDSLERGLASKGERLLDLIATELRMQSLKVGRDLADRLKSLGLAASFSTLLPAVGGTRAMNEAAGNSLAAASTEGDVEAELIISSQGVELLVRSDFPGNADIALLNAEGAVLASDTLPLVREGDEYFADRLWEGEERETLSRLIGTACLMVVSRSENSLLDKG